MSDDFSMLEKDLLLFDTQLLSNEPIEICEVDPFSNVPPVGLSDDELLASGPAQIRPRWQVPAARIAARKARQPSRGPRYGLYGAH